MKNKLFLSFIVSLRKIAAHANTTNGGVKPEARTIKAATVSLSGVSSLDKIIPSFNTLLLGKSTGVHERIDKS